MGQEHKPLPEGVHTVVLGMGDGTVNSPLLGSDEYSIQLVRLYSRTNLNLMRMLWSSNEEIHADGSGT